MSILSGFSISTLGMRAQATALHVIGTNVSNVQTGGFKRADVKFQTVLGDKLFQQADIGGTRPKILPRNTIQGNLQTTGELLDLAVIGDGFFITRPTFDNTGDVQYSRDGSFSTRTVNTITLTNPQTGETFQTGDSYIVDKNKNFVLGRPANADGTFSTSGALQPMRVDRNAFIDQGTATTAAELRLNLDSNAATAGNHLQAVSRLDNVGIRADGMEVFSIGYVDSNGTQQTARLNFTKAGINQWDVSATYDGAGSAQIDEVTLLGDVIDVGDSYSVTVAGQTVSYTAVDGDTMTDVVSNLVTELNANATIAATATAAAGASSGVITLTGVTAGTAFTSSASGSNGPDVTQVDEITLSGAVEPGERFEITISGTTIFYDVTPADTTLNDVANGLIANINANATTAALVNAAAGAEDGSITLTGNDAERSFWVTGAVAQSDQITFTGSVDAGDVYSIVVDGNTVSYTATGGEADLAAIRTRLINNINGDATTGAIVTAVAGPANGEIILTANTASASFTATASVENNGAIADNAVTTVAAVGGDVLKSTIASALIATNDNAASSTTIFGAQPILTTTAVTRLNFGGDGVLDSPDDISLNFFIPETESNPAATTTFDMDISNIRQLASPFLFYGYTENGFEASSLKQVTFDNLGHVVGLFDSGRAKNLYQVPLARFRNPDGLKSGNGQLFTETAESGRPMVETIGGGATATLAVGVREISNVTLVDEFTALIRTQQAYNSSATAFRTVDEMYQTVTQMKR